MAQGLAVVLISHKMQEVLGASDRVTVLRDGRVVGQLMTRETTQAELARLMVGRETFGVTRAAEEVRARPGRSRRCWSWPKVAAAGDKGNPALRGAELRVGPEKSWRWPGWPATARASWPTCCRGCGGHRAAACSLEGKT